jgi:hypothetical protein
VERLTIKIKGAVIRSGIIANSKLDPNNIKIISYYNYTMKLLKPFLLCIPLFFPVTCEGFIMPILQQTKTIINPLHLLEPTTPEHHEPQSHQLPMQKNIKNIKNKIGQIMNLIRAHHIAPTLFLCISGGWLMNPSIFYLLHSVPFVVSTINIILIMSASMAINDLYDIAISIQIGNWNIFKNMEIYLENFNNINVNYYFILIDYHATQNNIDYLINSYKNAVIISTENKGMDIGLFLINISNVHYIQYS